jgi:transcriptional regulator with XRE-family HTH domain
MAKGRSLHQTGRAIVAHNLRRHRKRLGISQEELAALAGLHHNYVGSVERAERNVSVDNIDKLAAAVGVSAASLLTAPRATGR